MMNAIGYIRVSTTKQFERGLSLDTQRKQIRALAKANNLRIIKFHEDGATAQNEVDLCLRPGLNAAMKESLDHGRPIITASADRFSRTVNTYDRFIGLGGRVYSADVGFGADEAIIRNAILRAGDIGKGISTRTREGLERARARGVRFGNPRLAEARVAAAAVLRAKAAAASEEFRGEYSRACAGDTLTASQVAEAFNNSGYSTVRSERWTGPNVRRMLRGVKAADKAADLVSREDLVNFEGSDAAIFGADRRATPYGLSLLRAAAAAKGIEQQKADEFCRKVMGRTIAERDIKRMKAWIADGLAH